MAFNSNPFTGNKWFKGNLHVHTTNSDGTLSPARVKDIYRRAGYDFLSFADHDLYDCAPELSDGELLIIPGGEFGANAAKEDLTPLRPENKWHFVLNGLDPESPGRLPAGFRFRDEITPGTFDERIQRICALARSTDNLVTLAHPANCRHFECTPASSPYFDAIEIYNNAAEAGEGAGVSTHHWDYLLRNGFKVLGIASDDAHFRIRDGCGGWIMVSADRLDAASIMSAVKNGSFYSTTGPQIFAFSESDGAIRIRCSPCYKIRFVQYDHRGRTFYSPDGKDSLTEAEFRYDPRAKYVRVECVRRDGKTAWTNPIFPEYPYPTDDTGLTERTDPEKEKHNPVFGVRIKTDATDGMKNRFPLRNGGGRYKGNLHAHTTNSDGKLSPEAICDKYAENGYAFLAITDHRRYTNTDKFDCPGFITLPGTELDIWCGSFDSVNAPATRQYTYHLNGILRDYSGKCDPLPDGFLWTRPTWDESWLQRPLRARVQEVIDFLHAHGNLVMINHPNWSVNFETDVYGFENVFAMELYNNVCEKGCGNGYSLHYYDYCLMNNMPLFGTATDDTHAESAALGGWVVVSAPELSRESITNALSRGCFYASNGPEIDDFYLDGDGYLKLCCSPARKIIFTVPGSGGYVFESGDIPLTGARYKPRPGTLVRATVCGPDDTYAWTNPILCD